VRSKSRTPEEAATRSRNGYVVLATCTDYLIETQWYPVGLDADQLIRQQLEFLAVSPHSLLERCDLVEDTILARAGSLVIDRISLTSQLWGWRFRSASRNRFYIDTELYEVRVTEHPTTPTTIQIAVVPANHHRDLAYSGEPLTVSLDGNGRYLRAHLFLDCSFERCEDRLAADLQAHFRAGYRWLEAHVMGELLSLEHQLASELYVEVRSVLDHPIVDLVALYIVDRGGAYYMLDPRAIQIALARATARHGTSDESSIELTALLVTQLLTPGETVAQASLKEHRTLDVPLEQSQYVESGLQIAENVFYGTMNLVSQPLVYEGDLRITAVYPCDLQGRIAARLTGIAGSLAEIVKKNASLAARRTTGRSARRVLSEQDVDRLVDLFGRFSGSFAGSFADTQM
jgi:hypothetical protein